MRSGIDRERELMLLNGTIECGGYVLPLKDTVEFSLSSTTIAAVADLAAPYVLTEDDGETVVASFAGYAQTAVYLGTEEGSVRMRAARELPTESKEAIEAVEANVAALTTRVTTTEATAAEAMETAEGAAASANPQLVTLAAYQLPAITPDMSVTEVAGVSTLLPEWREGVHYTKGEAMRHEGKVYRAAQDIPESQGIYPPGEGTESLYTLIDLAPDGIRVWHTVTDATNSFALGEKAHYPDAEGPVYVSKRNGNTSEPGTDEWWELAE